jgi:hypothetical protein
MKVLTMFGLLAFGFIATAVAAFYGIYEMFKPIK